MKKFVLLLILMINSNDVVYAFDPGAGEKGSFAISKENKNIIAWAIDFKDYFPGDYLDEIWMNAEKAVGKAEGLSSDIVSLGRGGEITLIFDPPIKNYNGFDFAVFENSFSNYFLELANVYVSTNGVDFTGFKTVSNTISPVTSFGNLNPEDIKNFAGKYRQGFGTGFDLEELKENKLVKLGIIDLDNIVYLKIKDIPGDGSIFDSNNNPVYDPYPTFKSAGFDLDGACSLNGVIFNDDDDDPVETPDDGEKDGLSSGFGNETGCFISSFF